MGELILSNSKSSCSESICRNCERAVADQKIIENKQLN
jgi:hypothetical protein